MKTNHQGRRGHAPHAVTSARHEILAAGHLHLDLLCIRRLELEYRTFIRQYARVLSTKYIRRCRRSILDSRGLHTLCSAAPGKVGIKRLQSRLVGNRTGVWRACEGPKKIREVGAGNKERIGRAINRTFAIDYCLSGGGQGKTQNCEQKKRCSTHGYTSWVC